MLKIINILFTPIKLLLKYLLLAMVFIYRNLISPLTPASCRHIPTCSEYMVESIKIHGPFVGFWLGIKRLSHCHPWGTHGYDPVPTKEQLSNKWYKKLDVKKLK